MYAVTNLYTARPEHVGTLKTRLVQLAAATLSDDPTCRTFDICFDPDDDLTVFLYRVFETPEDFLAHLESDAAQEFQESVEGWVSASEQRAFRRL